MYTAFLEGRAAKDPSAGWYGGELWFFDNWVIPLAGKLRECGVFGVSSDEYLTYAEQNRKEWEKRGHDFVAQFIAEAQKSAKKRGVSLKRMDSVVETEDESSEISTSSSDDEADLFKNDESVGVRREILVPPGKLGVTIDFSHSMPVIHEVHKESAIADLVKSGDCIVEIDGASTYNMTEETIYAIMGPNNGEVRKVTVASYTI
jgi:C-terminal processing protease CtpA/Prc